MSNILVNIISLPWRAGQRRLERQQQLSARLATAATSADKEWYATLPQGTTKPPVPEPSSQEAATPRTRSAPAPGHDHGRVIREILVYERGHTQITHWPSGATETIPGDGCPACDAASCSLCAFRPVYDEAHGRTVRRYERCPAHIAKERQP